MIRMPGISVISPASCGTSALLVWLAIRPLLDRMARRYVRSSAAETGETMVFGSAALTWLASSVRERTPSLR